MSDKMAVLDVIPRWWAGVPMETIEQLHEASRVTSSVMSSWVHRGDRLGKELGAMPWWGFQRSSITLHFWPETVANAEALRLAVLDRLEAPDVRRRVVAAAVRVGRR